MDELGPVEAQLKNLRKLLYTHYNQAVEMQINYKIRMRELDYEEVHEKKEKDECRAFDCCMDSPLRNEYILDMVANYLPAQELRNCRSVCQLWNRTMGKCLLGRKTLIVTDSTSIEKLSLVKEAVRKFVNSVGRVCLFDVTNSSEINSLLIARFGWTLSTLKIHECGRSAADLKELLLRQVPHLETFAYYDSANQESQQTSTFAIIKRLNEVEGASFSLPELKRLEWNEKLGKVKLTEIIEACPNLVELYYQNAIITSTPDANPALPQLPPCGTTTVVWDKLKRLQLSPQNELTSECFNFLTSLNLRLKALTLYGITSSNSERMENLSKFLVSTAETLNDLELIHYFLIPNENDRRCYSPFPKSLPQLETLKLDFSILETFNSIFHFPLLKTFDCRAANVDDWNGLFINGLPRNEAYCPAESYYLGVTTAPNLEIFSKYFTQCTDLEVEPSHIDDAAMQAIIKGFPRLAKLKIMNPTAITSTLPLTDAGLVGSLSLQTASETGKHKPVGIYHLKDLRILEIFAEHSSLTDAAVIHGIAKCKRLAILALPTCNVTDASVRAIQEHLKQLSVVDLSHCENISKSALKSLVRTNPALLQYKNKLFHKI